MDDQQYTKPERRKLKKNHLGWGGMRMRRKPQQKLSLVRLHYKHHVNSTSTVCMRSFARGSLFCATTRTRGRLTVTETEDVTPRAFGYCFKTPPTAIII